ncbi:hypothetical protein ABPG72_002589 [Tetrahymena utriculariae]
MNQFNQEDDLIIMKNVLFLAQSSKKSKFSQRNLLNKWFQDSVKSYLLESIASPLIIDYLQLSSPADVKSFIHKCTDRNKPKYMGVIEQYFFYIKKYNQQDLFTSKLQNILLDPVDITQQNKDNNYNTMKAVRKQFVCFLILKYFKLYGQQEMQSFYDLWNTCFPQEVQIKKKLSKYDKKDQNKMSKINHKQVLEENNSLRSSQDLSSCSTNISNNNQTEISNQENITTPTNNLDILLVNQQENFQSSYNYEFNLKKQPINNHIFEQDSFQQESMNYCLQHNNNDSTFYQNEDRLNNEMNQQSNNFKKYEDQQQFFQDQYYQLCFQQQELQKNSYQQSIYLDQQDYVSDIQH